MKLTDKEKELLKLISLHFEPTDPDLKLYKGILKKLKVGG